LELPNGVTQEVSAWSGSVLTTPEDVTGSVVPGTTTYKLRKASTVSDVFGATNSVGLKSDGDEDPFNNDLILVPNSSNTFDTIYYFDNTGLVDPIDVVKGWFTTGGDPADNFILNYADGFFVQRQPGAGAPLTLTVTGEVKTVPTNNVLLSGFNYVGAVAPVGLTLANSGLQNFLTIATNETEAGTIADFVLQQQPDGTYRTAYYFNDGETVGWFDTGGDPADTLVLDTGFLIQNKGSNKSYTLSVPSSYSSL
jgi:hypothetical protein